MSKPELPKLRPATAQTVNQLVSAMHGRTLGTGERLIVLSSDELAMERAVLLVKGRLDGLNWSLAFDGWPWHDDLLAPYTGGRPLDDIDTETASLALRLAAEETFGEVQDLVVDGVVCKPVPEDFQYEEWDFQLPIALEGKNATNKLVLRAAAGLELTELLGRFGSKPSPSLPADLGLSMRICAGSVSLPADDFADLAVGDIVMLGAVAPSADGVAGRAMGKIEE